MKTATKTFQSKMATQVSKQIFGNHYKTVPSVLHKVIYRGWYIKTKRCLDIRGVQRNYKRLGCM